MTASARDPVQSLVVARATGDPIPTLDQLGGVDLLTESRNALLEHDELAAIVGLVCDDLAAVEAAEGHDFLVAAARTAQDPVTMEEVMSALLGRPEVVEFLGEDLTDAWLDLSRTRVDLLGGIALESAARLVLAGAASPYGLLDRLHRLPGQTPSLDDDYAIRAVRVAGAVAEHFDVPEIPRLLDKFVERDEVAEDAAYELGMLALRQALITSEADTARPLLLEARRRFSDARADEERPDADAFGAAIDAVLAYAAGAVVPAEVGQRLGHAVQEIRLNLLGLPAGWRGPRLETLSGWQSLLDTLTRAQAADEPRAWLHAGAIIRDLVAVYTAHRTLELLARTENGPAPALTPGLHSLLAPRVERTLLAREGGMALLDQWLEELSQDPSHDDDPATPLAREQAIALRQALIAGSRGEPPKPDRPAAWLAGLGLSVDDSEYLEELLTSSPEAAQRMTAMSEAWQAQLPVDEVPIIASVYRETRRQLQRHCPDGYISAFAADIDRMLLLLLRFMDLRLSETQKFGGEARVYLRRLQPGDPKPLEKELGRDMRDFLRGQGLRVHLEVSNVGGGRVDVSWQPHDELITIELKRDWDNASWESYAEKYAGQAISYQAVGPPVSFLAVLDLTDKPEGLAAISACVEVRTFPGPSGDRHPRTLIMMRVQGNKRDPSDL
jgi:hypothetical protein